LTDAGLEYGEIEIPYYVDGYGKTERIDDIQAIVYNLQGGLISRNTITKDQIFDEIKNEYWRIKKFALPDVKAGSIIEYSYTHQTPFLLNLPDWKFQDRIPTIHSNYTVRMIPFYSYVFVLQGVSKFEKQSSNVASGGERYFAGVQFKDVIHSYEINNTPAFRDEDYITSIDDYIIKMDFQLSNINRPNGTNEEVMTTWEDLNSELLEHYGFGRLIKKHSKKASEIIGQIEGLNKLNERKACEQIIEYVKNNYRWDRFYGKVGHKTVKEFLNTKSGNVADINLYTIALLRAAGINADPVILSTRNNGKIVREYPFSHVFNYTAILISTNSETFLADATQPSLPYNRLPPYCINERGLVVKEGSVDWVNLVPPNTSINQTQITMNIDTSGLTAHCDVSNIYTEFEAYYEKKRTENASARISNSLEARGYFNVEVNGTRNFDSATKPYIISTTLDTQLDPIGSKISLTPFLDFPPSQNRLTQIKRTYPVDFVYRKNLNYSSFITLPKNIRYHSLPKPYHLDNELIKIDYSVTDKGNQLQANAIIEYKKAVYKSHEYARIKHYIDTMVKKFNEGIPLEMIE
jgi:hypothetical protein